jgi:3-polyprenyl-4-hydroxybenzoate decarboxylase
MIRVTDEDVKVLDVSTQVASISPHVVPERDHLMVARRPGTARALAP